MQINITREIIAMAGDQTNDSPLALAISHVTGKEARVNSRHILLSADTPEQHVPHSAIKKKLTAEGCEWFVMTTPRHIVSVWYDILNNEIEPTSVELN